MDLSEGQTAFPLKFITHPLWRNTMNKDQAKGQWNQIKGKVKETYAKLGDTDFALLAEGKADQFFGRIQEVHGDNREAAEKKLNQIEGYKDYSDSCGCGSKHAA